MHDSIEIKLIYLLKELLEQDGEACRRHLNLIPIFYSNDERKIIEKYIEENRTDILVEIKKESENICLGYNYDGDEERSKWDREEIAVTKVVKKLLNEYRKEQLYAKSK